MGGKTGVDLPQGKNLAGAFGSPAGAYRPGHAGHPAARYFADGMGEVIKYGCIRSRALFDSLKDGNARERIEDIIFQCVDIKRQVVENDERDKGERMILNFGHTLGHSLEKAHHFQGLSHGEAVASAWCGSPSFGGRGFTQKGTRPTELCSVLRSYGLPVSDSVSDQAAAQGRCQR